MHFSFDNSFRQVILDGMKTSLELREERDRVYIRICDLTNERKYTYQHSAEFTAIETAIAQLRIRLAQIQQEIIDRLPEFVSQIK